MTSEKRRRAISIRNNESLNPNKVGKTLNTVSHFTAPPSPAGYTGLPDETPHPELYKV